VKAIALFLAFILELCAVAAYGLVGYHYLPSLGVVMALLLVIFWAKYMAPQSGSRLKLPAYSVAKAVIFIGAVVLLAAAGKPAIAFAFVSLAIFDELLLFVSGESRPAAR
jgi:hypothetical protein